MLLIEIPLDFLMGLVLTLIYGPSFPSLLRQIDLPLQMTYCTSLHVPHLVQFVLKLIVFYQLDVELSHYRPGNGSLRAVNLPPLSHLPHFL